MQNVVLVVVQWNPHVILKSEEDSLGVVPTPDDLVRHKHIEGLFQGPGKVLKAKGNRCIEVLKQLTEKSGLREKVRLGDSAFWMSQQDRGHQGGRCHRGHFVDGIARSKGKIFCDPAPP